MEIKKIMIISLLAVLLVGCISTASAGWFDDKKETSLHIEQVSTTGNIEDSTPRTLVVTLNEKENGGIDGRKIEVTVKESPSNSSFVESGAKETSYDVTTSSTPHGEGTVEVCTLEPGKQYEVYAEFKGDDKYEASNLTRGITTFKL